MVLLPDLKALVYSFLPPKRCLGQHMCVAAFGRLQDDRAGGYEFRIRGTFREMRTHSNILSDCRRFGVHFGSNPTAQSMQLRMRLVEEMYLSLECIDEKPRYHFRTEDRRTSRKYCPDLMPGADGRDYLFLRSLFAFRILSLKPAFKVNRLSYACRW